MELATKRAKLDPRQLRTAFKVLQWALTYRGMTLQFKAQTLRQVFPPTAWGDKLRRMVLRKVRGYMNGICCITWHVDKHGIEDLVHLVSCATSKPATELVIQTLNEKFGDEVDSGDFPYKDTGTRLTHGLQNAPAEERDAVLVRNYPFKTDICVASATILYQLASATNRPETLLVALREYVDDRSKWRQHIADLLNWDLGKVKKLFQLVVSGAPYNGTDRASFGRMTTEYERILLRADSWWTSFRFAVRRAKQLICADHGIKVNTARLWNNLYLRQERRILLAWMEYNRQNGNRAFYVHDCAYTNTEHDLDELTSFIKQKTGFHIKFDQDVIQQEEKTIASQAASGAAHYVAT